MTEFDGLKIVHDAKDTLFHLASILCTENDHLHALEIDLDGCGRCHARCETIGGELTSVVNDKIGITKAGEFLGSRADEHVVLRVRA